MASADERSRLTSFADSFQSRQNFHLIIHNTVYDPCFIIIESNNCYYLHSPYIFTLALYLGQALKTRLNRKSDGKLIPRNFLNGLFDCKVC